MNLFFDSSALVKLFHEEDGTAQVTEWVEDPANVIWILDLARLEFASALHRRFRNHEIEEQGLSAALMAFSEQVTSFNVEPMRQSVVDEAEELLNQHGKVMGLRTLDALHLGAFLLISEEDWWFVAADQDLCKIAIACGCKVMNPVEMG